MHGIVSLLDQSHAAQVAAVWTSLQDRLGLQGMDAPPFPHVSYHVAAQYEVALLEQTPPTHPLRQWSLKLTGFPRLNL